MLARPGQCEDAIAAQSAAPQTGHSCGAEQDVARGAATIEKSLSSHGPTPQRPEGPILVERSTLAERRRQRRARPPEIDRVVRDTMIYHAVRFELQPQRRVALIWRLSEGRVSQIVKEFSRKVAENPELDDVLQRMEHGW
jgi:hypothetical protein